MKYIKFFALTLAILVSGSNLPAQNKKSADAMTPIVDVNLRGLLGGVAGGKWVKDKDIAKTISGKSEFILIGGDDMEKQGTIFGTLIEPDVPCEEYYGMKFDSDEEQGLAIGSNADWDLFPRQPVKILAGNSTYTKVISDYLKKQGLTRSVAKIKNGFKVDLDGDKQDEVVLAGTFYKDGLGPSASAGDYSFVLVRKIVGKTVAEILLYGDFIKKNVEFGAPNEYDISAIADLNGDGNMEIVVFGQYYEGSFSTVFEISGTKANQVLNTGCGV